MRSIAQSSGWRIIGGLLIAVVCSAVCFWACTRGNDFPVVYHPDEASKAAQLVVPNTPLNFNHPLLLLQAARGMIGTVTAIAHTPGGMFSVVCAGRYTSALFMAGAVFALCMVGFISHGPRGAILCGACLALCPELVLYGHYFKEDAALVFGLACTLLMARIVCLELSRCGAVVAAMVFGGAVGLAASGKYVGGVFLLPAVFAILLANRQRWRMALGCLLAMSLGLVATVVVVNRPAFARVFPPVPVAAVWEHFLGEVDHGTSGEDIVALTKPNAFCLAVAAAGLPVHVVAFLMAGVGAQLYAWRWSRWASVFTVFVATAVIAMAFCAIPFARYALPITLLAYLAAGQAVSFATELLPARKLAVHFVVFGGILCIITAVQGFRVYQLNKGFADDSRQRLREWVASSLPADAVVWADSYTCLGTASDSRRFPNQRPPSCTIRSRMYAAAYFDHAKQSSRGGVVYVAIASTTYERFFAIGSHASGVSPATFARYKDIYAGLLARGKVVWKYVPDHPSHAFTDPEIYVFAVRDPTAL